MARPDPGYWVQDTGRRARYSRRAARMHRWYKRCANRAERRQRRLVISEQMD